MKRAIHPKTLKEFARKLTRFERDAAKLLRAGWSLLVELKRAEEKLPGHLPRGRD